MRMLNEKFLPNSNIGLIIEPISKSGLIPLLNLINVINPLSNKIFLITHDKFFFNFDKENKKLVICDVYPNIPFIHKFDFINYILFQFKIAIWIIKKRTNIDFFIFFIGGDTLFIPLIISRLLRKKVFILIAGSSIQTFEKQKKYFKNVLIIMQLIVFFLSQNIILYSNRLVGNYGFTRWKNKILIAHEHFLDFNTFTVTTPYYKRSYFIGYIGRLSKEKGVQHFIQALPTILSECQDLQVLIGGDGQLKETIEKSLQEMGIRSNVDLPGWISHDDLPKYLNQLRLLVLPSYTEGLPNIMLEAMACGTPVLATPVGAIPDVIQDEVTGFIMENNTPECIAQNVMRALNHPDLEIIAERGRQYVAREFTFEKAVERWRRILEECEQ